MFFEVKSHFCFKWCVCIGWQENSPFESSIVCSSDCVLFSQKWVYTQTHPIVSKYLKLVTFPKSNDILSMHFLPMTKISSITEKWQVHVAIKLVNSYNFHRGDKVGNIDNFCHDGIGQIETNTSHFTKCYLQTFEAQISHYLVTDAVIWPAVASKNFVVSQKYFIGRCASFFLML